MNFILKICIEDVFYLYKMKGKFYFFFIIINVLNML